MSILLLDVGNSACKWALAHEGESQPFSQSLPVFDQHGRIALADINEYVLTELLTRFSITRCVVSDVSPFRIYDILLVITKKAMPHVQIIDVHSQRICGRVHNGYIHPETLGTDRWCALIAAAEICLPVCVVSCGSAITFDVIDKNGVHQGGVITAGIPLLFDAFQRTVLARETPKEMSHMFKSMHTYEEIFSLQRETDSAMTHGMYSMLVATCHKWLTHIRTQYGDDLFCVLTGGDAPLLSPYLPYTEHYPMLVLQGIFLYTMNLDMI